MYPHIALHRKKTSSLERHGIPLVPADLAAHEAVVYTQLGNTWTFSRDGTEASVTVSGKARFSAAEGIRTAVLSNTAIAVASDWMFAPELTGGMVRRILEDWNLPPIDLWAVFPTGRLASAKAGAFADFAQSLLRKA